MTVTAIRETAELPSVTQGRRAAFLVAGFLIGLLPLNTYWGLGGTWGLAWILGCADCAVPLPLVWVQEALLAGGAAVVLARSGVWRPRIPNMVWRLGVWTMATVFGAVGLSNLFGDNTTQARLLFAPAALALSALCVAVARGSARADRGERILVHSSSPAPGWARRVAYLAALTPVPSGLWRSAYAVGIPVGADEQYRLAHHAFPSWGTVYLFGLTFLLVGLAQLTLGLVQNWGEVVPRWIPFLGGRRVRPLAAVIPAGVGAVALTILWTAVTSNVQAIWTVYGLDGTARVVMVACYAPILLWGPLLGAVTVSYHRRHRTARI